MIEFFIVIIPIILIAFIITIFKNEILKNKLENNYSQMELNIQKRNEDRYKFVQCKINDFNNILNSISEYYIEKLEKCNKKLLYDMPELKFSNLSKASSPSSVSNYISIDVETTGLHAGSDEIIEISGVKFINFTPVEYFSTLIKPQKSISEEITFINNITNKMVSNSPKFSEVGTSFLNFLEDYNIVGHNLKFDIKFLYKNGIDFFLKKRKYFDTLILARKTINKSDIYNYKLDTVLENYDIYRDSSHRALSDALASGLLFEEFAIRRLDIDKIKTFYEIE